MCAWHDLAILGMREAFTDFLFQHLPKHYEVGEKGCSCDLLRSSLGPVTASFVLNVPPAVRVDLMTELAESNAVFMVPYYASKQGWNNKVYTESARLDPLFAQQPK